MNAGRGAGEEGYPAVGINLQPRHRDVVLAGAGRDDPHHTIVDAIAVAIGEPQRTGRTADDSDEIVEIDDCDAAAANLHVRQARRRIDLNAERHSRQRYDVEYPKGIGVSQIRLAAEIDDV